MPDFETVGEQADLELPHVLHEWDLLLFVGL